VAGQAIVTVFSALADETRLDIVTRLATRDATLSELAEHYDMSIQAVSKHLSVLEEAGVVSRRREAQRRPARLEAGVFDLMTKWIERYRQNAEAATSASTSCSPSSTTKPPTTTKEQRHDEYDQRRGRDHH